ncbi:uncharacterized protein G2W53_013957 [Senna tora]|uniref:Retrotransposon Copia-like N-terminal domain-containing protein n=1 Tax=Senna tora TaxID=362788 RepID=A0A834U0K3_9FABA|nr:uncharacterized protein G2W53_013957 [Senna tora]
MASSASSASSATIGSSVLGAQATKSHSLFNSSSQTASIKLDRDNYLVWEFVVRSLIKGNRLLSHIDGLVPPHPPKIAQVGLVKMLKVKHLGEEAHLKVEIAAVEEDHRMVAVVVEATVETGHIVPPTHGRGYGSNTGGFSPQSPQAFYAGFLNKHSTPLEHKCIVPLFLGGTHSGSVNEASKEGIQNNENKAIALMEAPTDTSLPNTAQARDEFDHSNDRLSPCEDISESCDNSSNSSSPNSASSASASGPFSTTDKVSENVEP